MERSNRTTLQQRYDVLCDNIGMRVNHDYDCLGIDIRNIIQSFMASHKRVAVYCYGEHTRMLFTDFIAELRDIVCIIDNGNPSSDSKFQIIKDEDIDNYCLDGIIVSSFRYKDEIKADIQNNHGSIDALDLYEELHKQDIHLEHEFYFASPYQIYSRINKLLTNIKENESVDLFKSLLEEYICIKDFRLAGDLSDRIYEITGDDRDKEIHELIEELYKAEVRQLAQAGENNILMLCLDGMRRVDFYQGGMEQTYNILKDSAYSYNNAYSYSTMTYESLIPVFEEDSDQRTMYYLREEVESQNCRFMKKALDEGRFVAIYGDGNHYIYDERIKYAGSSQTVTEKLWDFINDIDGIDNGIFYLHELYESHYSFINPYTKAKLIAQGSAMLFDFLPQNSGKLRTDYKSQQQDAIRYLDDTLVPFIEALPCDLVLFADHGNIVLNPGTEIGDIETVQLYASEDWIRIPLVIRAGSVKKRDDANLISLMSLNDIMLSLMAGQDYEHDDVEYIKIGRSEIYNQQFKELYRLMRSDYHGEAFEGFIFDNGYKLFVFSDGRKKLYKTDDDSSVDDQKKTEALFEKVKQDITVYDYSEDES